MFQTLGLVEVSASHSPPQHRMPCRRTGLHSILDWTLRRVSDSLRLDRVAVVTDCPDQADELRHHCLPDIPVHHIPDADPLARAVSATDLYGARSLVRIKIENPLVDPALVDQLISSAEHAGNCDYATYALSNSHILASQVGIFADWFCTQALRKADEQAMKADRADLATYITQHPEEFTLRFLPAPAELDRIDVRLTMTNAEDWEHFDKIYEALGPDAMDWQRIAELLETHPDMRQRMAALNEHHSHSSQTS